MASIFKFISGLFHDPRFYKSAEIPADLPVEFWYIFLDMEIGSAVRKSVSVTPWSELIPEIKRLKIYSACSSSNPVVICVVTVLGHGKHVINLSKSEFIDKLPDGYNQILGREFDDGEEVSGGQWQKLAIARAFYEQAPLLILDEPTSAIDAEAEMEIFTNLQKIYRAKTLLLVSHRFSTVRNAKRIYVIEDGRISEAGSHQELLDRDGKYASMFRAQAKGYAE